MGPPPIQVFLTTIASQPALRQRQEYLLRILQAKKIPFTSYDLASDEDAKRLWRRKAPANKQQIPGILVGGEFPGAFDDFEDAVEHNELDTFLRLREDYHPFAGDAPTLPQVPIGVPGVATPLQMTPNRLRAHVLAVPPASPGKLPPVPVNKRKGEHDLGDVLSGFGLQGIKVTDDELRELVEEMGLGGDEAEDLVKGLGGVPDPEKEITAKGKGEGKEKEGPASVKPITPMKKIAEPNEGDSAKEAAPSAAPIPRK